MRGYLRIFFKKINTLNFKFLKHRFILWCINSTFLKSKGLYFFFPPVKTSIYRVILERSKKKIIRKIDMIKSLKKKVNLNQQVIEKLLEKELERKEYIENKAKVNLLAITVSVSLVLGGISLLLKRNIFYFVSSSIWMKLLFVLFGFGILYLLYGGLAALSSIRIKELWDIYLGDKAELEGHGDTEIKKELIKNIELNQLTTMNRTNYMESSYVGIRNGIMLLLLCVSISLLIFIFSKHTLDSDTAGSTQDSKTVVKQTNNESNKGTKNNNQLTIIKKIP